MLSHDQVEGKWTEIKAGIRNVWGRLSEEEIEQHKENINSLSDIVFDRYGETQESFIKKMNMLMESFNNETDKSLKLNDGESSFERNPTRLKDSDREGDISDFP